MEEEGLVMAKEQGGETFKRRAGVKRVWEQNLGRAAHAIKNGHFDGQRGRDERVSCNGEVGRWHGIVGEQRTLREEQAWAQKDKR